MKKKILILSITLSLILTANISKAEETTRISGKDRYETSIKISQDSYGNSDYVVLVTGENFPDAVSAGALSSYLNAPLLLVNPEVDDARIRTEISRLNPSKIYLIGGKVTNSKKITDGTTNGYETIQLSGKDRYETSLKIKEEMVSLGAEDIIGVTNGENFPDAIAAGGILAKEDMPLLLVNGKDNIVGDSNVKYIFGGKTVGNITGKKLSGSNRYLTSLKIAEEGFGSAETIILASGESYPDALSAISLSKKYNAPIILTEKNKMVSEVSKYVKNTDKIIIVGGNNSISSGIFNEEDNIVDSAEFSALNKVNNYSTDIIMTIDEINDYNAKNIAKNTYMNDVLNINKKYTKEEIVKMINNLSKLPSNSYSKSNKAHGTNTKNAWVSNLNMQNVKSQNELSFGVVTSRTLLRTFPTWDESRTRNGLNDFFSETALNPWDEILILHESKDKQWIFGITENYIGWISKSHMAYSTREKLIEYNGLEKEVVIERQLQIGGKNFDMGSDIPVKGERLLIPLTDKNNELQIKENPIPSGTNRGYLNYTKANLIRQALKFKGEQYGWGGSNNGHDCSSLIQDIHKSFGIKMPRNTYQQEVASIGKTTNLKNISGNNKMKKVESFQPGTALYMKGHVMMYLGKNSSNKAIVMHQYNGHYSKGKYVSVRSAQITDLLIGNTSSSTYLDAITTAVEYIK